jgi:hypothetical protein
MTYPPSTEVRLLVGIGSWPAGSVGVVEPIEQGLLNGYDLAVRLGIDTRFCVYRHEVEQVAQ